MEWTDKEKQRKKEKLKWKRIEIAVDGSTAGSGNLEILVNGGHVTSYVRELGNQCFLASFVPHQATVHTIDMRFNGEIVTGRYPIGSARLSPSLIGAPRTTRGAANQRSMRRSCWRWRLVRPETGFCQVGIVFLCWCLRWQIGVEKGNRFWPVIFFSDVLFCQSEGPFICHRRRRRRATSALPWQRVDGFPVDGSGIKKRRGGGGALIISSRTPRMCLFCQRKQT